MSAPAAAKSTDTEKINKYLTDLSKFLEQFDWNKVPPKTGGGGGEGSGTKPPPKFP